MADRLWGFFSSTEHGRYLQGQNPPQVYCGEPTEVSYIKHRKREQSWTDCRRSMDLKVSAREAPRSRHRAMQFCDPRCRHSRLGHVSPPQLLHGWLQGQNRADVGA